MAAQVTIIISPSDTEAGSFDIFQFIYDINGNPQVDPFLIESNVPASSLISPGHIVIVDDFAYGIRLVSNNTRGFDCAITTIDQFLSIIQITNNFLVSNGNLSITGVTFGAVSLSPPPSQNESTFITLNIGTIVQDTTTVGIINNEVINALSYQITVRDSDNILPFTNSGIITPGSGAQISFTGTTLSPNRQFRVLLDSFVPSSPMPTPSVTPTIPASPTVTPSVSATPGLSPSLTPSITSSRTPTPSLTPTISISASPGLSPSLTPTTTPTITPSKTMTPTVTISPTFTPTKTPTPTITPTASPPNSEVVMISNVDGVFDINNITVDGIMNPVYDLSIAFPIPPGSQSVGLTNQLGANTTVVVTLSGASSGEVININDGGNNCTTTDGSNTYVFSPIDTTGLIMITYGSGSC